MSETRAYDAINSELDRLRSINAELVAKSEALCEHLESAFSGVTQWQAFKECRAALERAKQ